MLPSFVEVCRMPFILDCNCFTIDSLDGMQSSERGRRSARSGGGGSTNTVLVASITVTGARGATTITTNSGTLQMQAAVNPANATNSAVTWSEVNGTGVATISTAGVLTAVANGTVTAKATAQDGSGVSGTCHKQGIPIGQFWVPVPLVYIRV